MRILVTGGSGFIGSHLTRALLALDPKPSITILDRAEPEKRISGVSYVIADVNECESLPSLVESSDAIFHFAALVSVAKSQAVPEESHRDTVLTTSRILSILHSLKASGKKIPKLIYSSTAAIYGDSVKSPSDFALETYEPKSFLSHYAHHKFEAEELLRSAHAQFALSVCIFRFFNVYGPGQDPKSPYSGVVSIYMDRAKNGKTLTIFGDGKQSRDFIHISDICLALVSTLKNDSLEAWNGIPINLGVGKSITISELAEMISIFPKNKIQIEYQAARTGDVKYSCADISRAKTLLKFQPSVPISIGLKSLYNS